jgi:hypothetical protein
MKTPECFVFDGRVGVLDELPSLGHGRESADVTEWRRPLRIVMPLYRSFGVGKGWSGHAEFAQC